MYDESGDSQIELPQRTLGDLARLCLEQRCALILATHEHALQEALGTLRRWDAPLPPRMDARWVAWALAGVVCGTTGSSDVGALAVGNQGDRVRDWESWMDRKSPATRWGDVWASLVEQDDVVAVSVSRSAPIRRLEHLVMSAACELSKGAKWRPPDIVLDVERANGMFTFVYNAINPKVLRRLRYRFPYLSAEWDACAQDAWLDMFMTVWGSTAPARFLAQATIDTYVQCIADRKAIDLTRRKKTRERYDEQVERDVLRHKFDLMTWDPLLRRHVRACLETLNKNDRLALELVDIQGIPQTEVATRMGVKPPRIHQRRAKARTRLIECLKAKGIVG